MTAAILSSRGAFRSAIHHRPQLQFQSAILMATRRSFSSYLVTPSELSEELKKNSPSKISTSPRTVPLCAAWFLPNDDRKGLDTFRQKRIPNARFFDLDKVIDKHSPYPHMLPSASDFAKAISGLGIRKDDTVVVYDTAELGIFSAPRVAWMLKIFGHPSVHILNNFKLWVEEGYTIESGEFWDVDTCVYPIPEFDESKVIGFEEVKEFAKDYNKEGAEGVQILDARSKGRWAGKDPEPRPGLSSGHMPSSISVPFSDLLDPVKKTILPGDELRKIFLAKSVDPERPIISSCGTGVTAAVIDAALSEAGYGDESKRRLYDGSWTEWAQRVQPSDGLIIKEE
ncbi:putative thiosulfate sulfurtransferase TUM1 [Venustampulla echinocandica]|uniref:Putative thiosulfate sulfurtransferase TUM1 n=1 Tax=Venustampulla echinocandica TaxID=2656787 RepID=A0A370TB37_9HELO|nr:putative thiosulfate sulfurtransferase TUM1 [Venustampulla echinocandica]RDL31151.1 putative thiosulfate sulfurtransferase TUM1 [Venustampulla echinocandica]